MAMCLYNVSTYSTLYFMCAYVYSQCVWTHLGVEATGWHRILPPLPSSLCFKTRSLAESEFTDLAKWPASQPWDPCVLPTLFSTAPRLQTQTVTPGFSMIAGVINSGLHAYTAGTLPTEPPLQTQYLIFSSCLVAWFVCFFFLLLFSNNALPCSPSWPLCLKPPGSVCHDAKITGPHYHSWLYVLF